MLLEEERELQHRPGWLLHPHPILTRAHTDPTTLAHLQTTEPRRPTVPDTALHREEHRLPDAATSGLPGGGGEAGRRREIHGRRERGERSSLSLSRLLSLFLCFSLIAQQPPLSSPTPHLQVAEPLSQPCALRLSLSAREVALFFHVLPRFVIVPATTAGREPIYLLSITFLLRGGRKGKVVP